PRVIGVPALPASTSAGDPESPSQTVTALALLSIVREDTESMLAWSGSKVSVPPLLVLRVVEPKPSTQNFSPAFTLAPVVPDRTAFNARRAQSALPTKLGDHGK